MQTVYSKPKLLAVERLHLTRALQMSEELQNDLIDTVVEPEQPVTAIVNQSTGSDLASDSGDSHEQKQPVVEKEAPFSDGAQIAINKQHKKYRTEKREKEALQSQLDAIAAKERDALAETHAKELVFPPAPVFPDDEFADNYPELLAQYHADVAAQPAKVAAYAEAFQAKATYTANQNVITQQSEYQQQQKLQEQNEKAGELFNDHRERAKNAKIGISEIEYAERVVMSSGMDVELQRHVLAMPDSHLVMKHLAGSSEDLANLVSNPWQVGIILSDISEKAKSLQPATTNTPEPVVRLSGSGADPSKGKYPNSSGAKFY